MGSTSTTHDTPETPAQKLTLDSPISEQHTAELQSAINVFQSLGSKLSVAKTYRDVKDIFDQTEQEAQALPQELLELVGLLVHEEAMAEHTGPSGEEGAE